MIPIQNVLEKTSEKIAYAEITPIFDALEVLTLMAGLACVAVPCLLIEIPGSIVALILKVSGHTAAAKEKEERRKKMEKEEDERIDGLIRKAYQYYEENISKRN